jgi:hypothetical protein
LRTFHENSNFFKAEVGKKVKNQNFIPNHHFWMSEGSLSKVDPGFMEIPQSISKIFD